MRKIKIRKVQAMKREFRILSLLLCLGILISSAVIPAGAAAKLPESKHPYEDEMDEAVTSYVYDGADKDRVGALRVTFSPETMVDDSTGFDVISVFGSGNYLIGDYTGSQLAGRSLLVPGLAVYICMTTDAEGVNLYGYKVTSVEPLYIVRYSFETNGGSPVESEDTAFLAKSPRTQKEGKYFAGWYDNKDLSGEPVSFPYRSDGDITLYAAWSDTPHTLISDFEYEVEDDGTVTVIKYVGNDADVYIPDEAEGFPVKTLFANAFSGSGVVSVTVGAGMTAIDDYAFNGCTTLENIGVDGENPVYMSKDGALYDKAGKTLKKCPCAAEGVFTVPSGVTSLGTCAFADCVNLSGAQFPSAIKTIPTYAFKGCTSLVSFTVPATVTSIGERAFSGCRSLVELDLHSGIKSIGKDAFINTGLYNDHARWEKGVLYEDGYLLAAIELDLPETVVVRRGTVCIADYAFENMLTFTKVSFPETLDRIGARAFYGCACITGLDLPGYLKTVGDYCFKGCTAMTYVNVPDSVTSLGNMGTFDGDTALERAELGSGLKSIPTYAFRNCTSLKSVYISDSVTTVSTSAFSGCKALSEVRYTGTREKWDAITVRTGNDPLKNIEPTLVTPRWNKADINNDGKINVTDRAVIKKIILGVTEPTADEFFAADLNSDGKVNAYDGNLLISVILGRINPWEL